MKINKIDIKTRLLAKPSSMYGYHNLINLKPHSYTDPNNSATNQIYKEVFLTFNFTISLKFSFRSSKNIG